MTMKVSLPYVVQILSASVSFLYSCAVPTNTKLPSLLVFAGTLSPPGTGRLVGGFSAMNGTS